VRGRRLPFLQRLAQHPPLPVDGLRAYALGARRVRLPQLARAMGTQGRPGVRGVAMQRLLASIEADPALRAGLRDMTAQQLAGFARSTARAHAPELTTFLSRRARDPVVRARARAALSTLR
jgi:hypothetical protein